MVMVENIFRELAERHGEDYDLIDVIRAAAHDVERPIFYAVAVIIAGYLPIYVLTGPSGRLFQPMADTMSFALVGSLLCALTLLPVLCAYLLRRQDQGARGPALRSRSATATAGCSAGACAIARVTAGDLPARSSPRRCC